MLVCRKVAKVLFVYLVKNPQSERYINTGFQNAFIRDSSQTKNVDQVLKKSQAMDAQLIKKLGTGAMFGAGLGSLLALLGYTMGKNKQSNEIGVETENVQHDSNLLDILERVAKFRSYSEDHYVELIKQCDLLCGVHALALSDGGGRTRFLSGKVHHHLYNITGYLRALKRSIPLDRLNTLHDFAEVEKDLLKACSDYRHNVMVESL